MELYLCEKPSQARSLANVLGCSKKEEGYISGTDKIVTWCFGHLVELYSPNEYDPTLEKWNLEQLPIIPEQFKNKVKKDCQKQFNIIKKLLSKCSVLMLATDMDREGCLLGREVLILCGYKGPIKRVCLTALDDESIKSALRNVKDGSETVNYYYAALARSHADWLVGMNFSRLFTLVARQHSFPETIQIGRVQTPTVALVVRRDEEIENFKPSPFYTVDVNVQVQKGNFVAHWKVPENMSDPTGHCVDRTIVQAVINSVKGENAIIEKSTTKKGAELVPLPFDLNSIQQFASKKWGYTAQETLDICQSLYETHKATTYPRTDCRYLPESIKDEVRKITGALLASDSSLGSIISGADLSRNSRCFDTSKVTAHHGIIPTTLSPDLSKMNEKEFNVYRAIRAYFLIQFYEDATFMRSIIDVDCHGYKFFASGKVPLTEGFKMVLRILGLLQEKEPSENSEKDPPDDIALPSVQQGEPARIAGADLIDKMTAPPPHFTEATLLSAMENVSKFVTEEKFKKILKDSGGLATPATRSSILETAISHDYLKRSKKLILSTPKAKAVIAMLPKLLCSAGLTGAWEQQLDRIVSGEVTYNLFRNQIQSWVKKTVENLKNGTLKIPEKTQIYINDNKSDNSIEGYYGEAPICQNCGTTMVLRKSKKNTVFWGCPNYPECREVVWIDNPKKQSKRKKYKK